MIRLQDEESSLVFMVFRGAIVGFFDGSNQEDWESAVIEEDEQEEDEEEEENGHGETTIGFARRGWVGQIVLPDERFPSTLSLTLRQEHDPTVPEMTITISGIAIEEQNNRMNLMRLSCECDEGQFTICFSRITDHCRLFSGSGDILKSFIIDHDYPDAINAMQIFSLELSVLLEYISGRYD